MKSFSEGPLICLPVATEHGTFSAVYSSLGLRHLHFPGEKPGTKLCRQQDVRKEVKGWHSLVNQGLARVLLGRSPSRLPPMDWSTASEFQKRVWEVIQKVRPGTTISYGAIASRLGNPNASRAVGGACGANPIPLLVPCHRVLPANQKLGGFSGGLDWKKRLLALEGVWPLRQEAVGHPS